MPFPILATRDVPRRLGFNRDLLGGRVTYVDDCGGPVKRLRAAGVRLVAEPAGQPWGERVARVLDPDDDLLVNGRR